MGKNSSPMLDAIKRRRVSKMRDQMANYEDGDAVDYEDEDAADKRYQETGLAPEVMDRNEDDTEDMMMAEKQMGSLERPQDAMMDMEVADDQADVEDGSELKRLEAIYDEKELGGRGLFAKAAAKMKDRIGQLKSNKRS